MDIGFELKTPEIYTFHAVQYALLLHPTGLKWMWPQYLQQEYKDIKRFNLLKTFEAEWRKVIHEAAMPQESGSVVL